MVFGKIIKYKGEDKNANAYGGVPKTFSDLKKYTSELVEYGRRLAARKIAEEKGKEVNEVYKQLVRTGARFSSQGGPVRYNPIGDTVEVNMNYAKKLFEAKTYAEIKGGSAEKKKVEEAENKFIQYIAGAFRTAYTHNYCLEPPELENIGKGGIRGTSYIEKSNDTNRSENVLGNASQYNRSMENSQPKREITAGTYSSNVNIEQVKSEIQEHETRMREWDKKIDRYLGATERAINTITGGNNILGPSDEKEKEIFEAWEAAEGGKKEKSEKYFSILLLVLFIGALASFTHSMTMNNLSGMFTGIDGNLIGGLLWFVLGVLVGRVSLHFIK